MDRIKSLILIPALCLVGAYSTLAQYQISGQIINSDGEGLVNATAVLLYQEDSTMVTFGLSNEKGQFRLHNVKADQYLIQINYLGYATHIAPIESDWKEKTISLAPIELNESSKVLQEIEVMEERIPMGIHGDTISYGAAAFKTRPGATVEDLLKQLPGIEVDRSGNIKAQGEDVKKVLVDGDEFFGNDPKMATKNLEAEAVKKVKVYDKKSEAAEFTGIDDGEEEKTIDLELKESHKKGGFGRAEVAVGNKESFNTKLNYSKYNESTQASIIFSHNNINEQPFSMNDQSEFLGGLANAISARGIQPQLERGINRSLSSGINLNEKISSKLELKSYYVFNRLVNDLSQQTESTVFSELNTFNTIDSTISNKSNNNHRASITLKYSLDPMTTISFKNLSTKLAKFSEHYSNERYFEQMLFEGFTRSVKDKEEGDLENYSRINIKRKFKKQGRNMIGEYYLIRTKEDYENKLENTVTTSASPEHVVQDHFLRNHRTGMQAKFTYTEPIANQLYVYFSHRFNRSRERPFRDVYDVVGSDRTPNDILSADFQKLVEYQRPGIKFRKNYPALKLNAGVEYQKTRLEGVLSTSEDGISNIYGHWLPSAKIDFEPEGRSRINFSYRSSINAPRLEQLLPFVDNTNPNLEILGNPDLKPENSSNLSMSYSFFDNFSFNSLWSYISYSNTQNRIVYSTEFVDAFFQRRSPVNTDKSHTLNGSFYFSQPFRPLQLKYRVSARFFLQDYNSFVNGLKSNIKDNNYRLSLKISNRKTDHIYISTSISYTWDDVQYAINSDLDQKYNNYDWHLDMEYYPTDKLTLASNFLIKNYSNTGFADPQNFRLWSIHASYLLFKDRFTLSFEARDLLNEQAGYQRNSTINSLTEVQYNALNQYFLIGLEYNLGKKKGGGMRIVDKR